MGGEGDLELSNSLLLIRLDDATQTATDSLACVIDAIGYQRFDNGSYLQRKNILNLRWSQHSKSDGVWGVARGKFCVTKPFKHKKFCFRSSENDE